MGDATFMIHATPPSLNAVGTRGHWHAFNRHKKNWQADIEVWLMALRAPRGMEFVAADATLRFPKRRRRDEGNFAALLDKALGDALQNYGMIPDDTPQFYKFLGVTFEHESGPARTTIKVAWR